MAAFAGFSLSALIALPLGLIIGTYRPVQAFFEPLVEFARYLPAVAFVPLVLLWMGIGEGSKVTIIWIGTSLPEVSAALERSQALKLAPEFLKLKKSILQRIRETSGMQTDLNKLQRLQPADQRDAGGEADALRRIQ